MLYSKVLWISKSTMFYLHNIHASCLSPCGKWNNYIDSSVEDDQSDGKHEVCLYKHSTSCLALIISDQKGFLRLHCNASCPHNLPTAGSIIYASEVILQYLPGFRWRKTLDSYLLKLIWRKRLVSTTFEAHMFASYNMKLITLEAQLLVHNWIYL